MMKPSIPIHRLRRQARLLSRQQGLPLHAALDRLAAAEGFRSWSHMMADATPAASLDDRLSGSAAQVHARLAPGDLVLLGARPGEGKTLMSLGLVAEAVNAGHRAAFFTLEATQRNVMDRLDRIGADSSKLQDLLVIDCSDAIHADHVVRTLESSPRGTLAVIDYLQLLDQRRENPPLADQVRTLQTFAQRSGVIIVLLSQIDRSYDPSVKPFPDIDDVRLPNPVDLALFDRLCFLNDGAVRLQEAA